MNDHTKGLRMRLLAVQDEFGRGMLTNVNNKLLDREMPQLTDWERQQIDSIHLLLQQAADVVEYFKQNETYLSSQERSKPTRDVDKEQLQFRLIVFNLYSVLDYTYYLLYCHFSNEGQPDISSKSTQCGFPFKAKGVKISETSSQDQSKRFVEEKLRFLWGSKIGLGTHIAKEVGDVLLSVQPKLKVEANGDCPEHPVIGFGNEESFSLLHFYRNCCTHRSLIRFEAKGMIFEIDQTTRAFSVVSHKSEKEGVFCFEIPKTAYWIQLPEHVVSHRLTVEQSPRMLVEVLEQLFSFAKFVCSKLLFMSLLLPRFSTIIRRHCSSVSIEKDIVKPIDKKQHVTLTICSKGSLYEPETASHADKLEAEDQVCSNLLAKHSVYPDRPYTHFYKSASQMQYTQMLPIIRLTSENKNKRMLLNEYTQRVRNSKLTCKVSDEKPTKSGEQIFCVEKWIEIWDQNETSLLRIDSGVCSAVGKDKTNEEATKKLLDELVRLGFLHLE